MILADPHTLQPIVIQARTPPEEADTNILHMHTIAVNITLREHPCNLESGRRSLN